MRKQYVSRLGLALNLRSIRMFLPGIELSGVGAVCNGDIRYGIEHASTDGAVFNDAKI